MLPRRSAQTGTQPVLVASHVDYQRMSPRPVVYVEHGAGQSYDGDPASAGHGSYSGGLGLDRVVLFIGPSEQVCARWRERYPSTPAIAVGCPRLDVWHRGRVATLARDGHRSQATVAVTFHWECALVAESTSAWRHFDRGLPALKRWADEHDVELLGHGHPRLWPFIRPRWEQLGIEPVADFDVVLDRADVLAFDNTSAGYEFASLDRPVVVMNAPWYRRDVEHGGRFWRWADVGVQVDDSDALLDVLPYALSDPPVVRANRERIVSEVYGVRDGSASTRAADAIERLLNGDDVHR